jgi:hypothetical protein
MKNKRLLFLGFNKKYVNPYTETILRILGSIMDVCFYGLGYSNQEDLDLGIEKWIALQEDFDFIMTDGSVVLSSEVNVNVDENSLFSMDIINFTPKGNYFKHASEFYSFFMNSSHKKIVLAGFDAYQIKQTTVDYIEKTKAYIIDFGGHQLYDSLESINKKYELNKFKANDNWYNFLKKHDERIIVAPHTIGSLEFDFTPIALRKNKFTVIGAGYPERKQASKILPLKMRFNIFIDRIKGFFLSRLKPKMTIRKMALYQSSYFKKITDSQLSYCSGGPVLYPVRKYYEIPARGSVAIGRQCSGFDDLGFIDGVNFIVAHNNTELEASLKKYSLNELQKIADQGRKLIWEKHSDWARRKQLLETFNLIFKGTFKGSYWDKGEYKIIK